MRAAVSAPRNAGGTGRRGRESGRRDEQRNSRKTLLGAYPHPRRRDGDDDPVLQAFRGRVPRPAVSRPSSRPQRLQRPSLPDEARGHRGDPPPIPRRRRRHHRDQHVQLDVGLDGRLWPPGSCLCDQRGRGRDRRPRRARSDAPHARSPAVRGRVDGTDQPHGFDLPRRQQPGIPRDQLRRDGRRLL